MIVTVLRFWLIFFYFVKYFCTTTGLGGNMTNKNNKEIKAAIEECVKQVGPIFDLYACLTHSLQSKKMLDTQNSACLALTKLFAKALNKQLPIYCPQWQVMKACEQCLPKKVLKKKQIKNN
jgi:CHAD domain-containing protein